jgi:hypothetical protein
MSRGARRDGRASVIGMVREIHGETTERAVTGETIDDRRITIGTKRTVDGTVMSADEIGITGASAEKIDIAEGRGKGKKGLVIVSATVVIDAMVTPVIVIGTILTPDHDLVQI